MADVRKIRYSSVGENYEKKDPVKKLAQIQASLTSKNILPFKEVSESRGESAYVWKQNGIYMASVVEALGTKNLVADEMFRLTGKDYYENIAYDTVATIINDLVTSGARPITVHAYWAVGEVAWIENEQRIKNLISGWKRACDDSLAVWAGGESPTLKKMINPKAIILGGSAVGWIGPAKRLVSEKKIKIGDAIILIKSSGPNANAISLIRAVAGKLKDGYLAKLPSGETFGEATLARSHIYAGLVKDLLDHNIDVHYISNITGHGFRKIMRAKKECTYVIEKIFEPLELFNLIQKASKLTDGEMFATFNMGSDYAIIIPPKDIEKTLKIISKNKFKGIHAGNVEKGPRRVIIKPIDLIYSAETLDLR